MTALAKICKDPKLLAGYDIGCAISRRREWLDRAREHSHNPGVRAICVKTAREYNRELVIRIKHARSLDP